MILITWVEANISALQNVFSKQYDSMSNNNYSWPKWASNQYDTWLEIFVHILSYNIVVVSCTTSFCKQWYTFSEEYFILVFPRAMTYFMIKSNITFLICTGMTYLESSNHSHFDFLVSYFHYKSMGHNIHLMSK